MATTDEKNVARWHDGLPPSTRLQDIADRVEEDPRVLAVLLTGSWAHGLATEHSDIDLLMVLARDALSWRRTRYDGVDLQTVTIERLRHIPTDPSRWWDRYTYCRTQTLMDRSDGQVDHLLDAWCCLSEEEVANSVDYHLEGYLSYLYRSLKSHREGRTRLARLDAAESLPWALTLAFAVHGRVRPMNKYIAWELEHFPIEEPGWASDDLMGLVDAVLDSGCADSQRRLFRLIEAKARPLGFGGVIDTFEGLQLLRSDRAA